MRILLLENDPQTAQALSEQLSFHGFHVDVCHNGENGLLQAIQAHYDLIILEALLPQRDGWNIVSQLRRLGHTTRIMFLTACTSIEDRVKGLEVGADDYLIKPFAFSELLARLRSLLRREPLQSVTELAIADLTIDLIKRQASRQTALLDLTAKEFALLALLAERRGEILSRMLLSKHIWKIHFNTDTNMVDVAIRRLRQKVDDPFPVKLIHTVRGKGYLLDQR